MPDVWPTVIFGGKEYWQVESMTLLEKDPQGGVLYLVGVPNGSTGSVGPLVQGENGHPPILADEEIVTEIEWDNPTPVSSSWVMIDPGNETTGPTYQRHTLQRKGKPGDPGDTVLDPGDYGDPLGGQILVVSPDGLSFTAGFQKCGDRYIPATVNQTGGGQATFTLASVSIPPQPSDWRPEAQCAVEVTGTGPDVSVDIIARLGTNGILNPETAGNVVGRAMGSRGQYPPIHTMVPGPPAGSADAYDRVLAGNNAVIYFRAERQSGADSFITTAARTLIWVKVNPIPDLVP